MNDLLDRLAAALQDRYAVRRRAGEGGMATVLLAEDRKHRRDVAIKVMRPELSATVGAERFLREIELAAKLQHPHIVPVYDSGEAAGVLYYVMPFIDGETLRERIAREGPLPLADACQIAREVASALGYAHAQGVVHRDVKPENIMLSGGHAVVTDFGIARAVQAGGAGALTGMGLAIGTPAYMSPEQATASEVDARSDQYGVGCVLYEMLAGRQPFTGASAQSVITQAITAPRPRVRAVRRNLPESVDRVITRAMAKDPDDRFPTMADFSAALAEAATGGGSGGRRKAVLGAAGAALLVALAAVGWWLATRDGRTVVEGAERIAVLPFRTSGADVALMGEGMVDLLSTNLDAVGAVRTVEPRTVLQRWRKRGGTDGADLETALAVARDVDAGAVLLGSVIQTGGSVRLSAELVGRDGLTLARQQVDGSADSVLALVDRLSVGLMREIWRSGDPVPASHVAGITTTSVDAMRAYLQGEQYYRRSLWDSAAAAYTTAVERDSTFALAWNRLGTALGWIGNYGSGRSRQAADQALRYADRLPARERALVSAYHLFQSQQVAAVDSMERYVSAYPGDPDGWYLLAEARFHTLHATGAGREALLEPFDRVLALDSSLTPAAIHPLEFLLVHRDSAGFRRYLRVLDAAGATEEAQHFRLASVGAWDDAAPDTALHRLFREAAAGRALAGVVGIMNEPGATSDTVAGLLRIVADAVPGDEPQARYIRGLRPLVLAGLGRLAEAEELARDPALARTEIPFGTAFMPFFAGFAPDGWAAEYLARFRQAPRDNPYVVFSLATKALAGGDVAEAAPLIARGQALDSTPPALRGAFRALAGWRRVVAGDTTGGLPEMRNGLLESGGYASNKLLAPVRFHYALLLAANPLTRPDAIRRLRYGFTSDFEYLPIVQYHLGRIHREAGEREAAAEAYGRFLRLWDKADSRLQPYLSEARTALEELTAEPRT